MKEGRLQLAPMPFIFFCIQYPTECTANSDEQTVSLSIGKLEELERINREVNANIRPQADTTAERLWHLDVTSGDCNEFAVQKRHELIKAGWPAAALSLTVAVTSWGEGHLVVTVRTDRGDLVLDNLRRQIVTWENAHYRWVMRQSANDVRNWVSIEPPDSRFVRAPIVDASKPVDVSADASLDLPPDQHSPSSNAGRRSGV